MILLYLSMSLVPVEDDMKVGDLVRHKRDPSLSAGIVVGFTPRHPEYGVWIEVLWCEYARATVTSDRGFDTCPATVLEVVSEGQRSWSARRECKTRARVV